MGYGNTEVFLTAQEREGLLSSFLGKTVDMVIDRPIGHIHVTKGITRQKHSVVLQHDIHEFSVEAVEEIILWGLNNGYTFLPLEMDSPVFQHAVNN